MIKKSNENADRHNKGKLKWSLIDYKSLEPMVKVLEFGAKKYDRENWKKGLPFTDICDSLMRHLYSFMDGEDIDAESGISHIGHILCNAMFLSYMVENKKELDNRSKNKNSSCGKSCNCILKNKEKISNMKQGEANITLKKGGVKINLSVKIEDIKSIKDLIISLGDNVKPVIKTQTEKSLAEEDLKERGIVIKKDEKVKSRKYVSLAKADREALKKDSKKLSNSELCSKYNVSRNTVRNIISSL